MKNVWIFSLLLLVACSKDDEMLKDEGVVVYEGIEYAIDRASCMTETGVGMVPRCDWEAYFLKDGEEYRVRALAMNVSCSDMENASSIEWLITMYNLDDLNKGTYQHWGNDNVVWDHRSFGFDEVVMENTLGFPDIVFGTRGLISCAR